MHVSENAKANSVPAQNQLAAEEYVKIVRTPGSTQRILFVGNSITRPAPKPSLEWYNDWGMAATALEKDYVHQTLRRLREKYGEMDYCIAQAGLWETHYTEGDEVLEQQYAAARDFAADIVIIRLGENINREKHAEISCKPYYDRMVRFFASNPNARVIVTDNFWKMESLDTVIRAVAEERGYTFVHLGDLEDDPQTMALGQFKCEGVSRHPSDYGMEQIAERIVAAVSAL